MNLIMATTYIVEQTPEGRKFIDELKERNKGFVTKEKESTTSIVLEVTHHLVLEAEETNGQRL